MCILANHKLMFQATNNTWEWLMNDVILRSNIKILFLKVFIFKVTRKCKMSMLRLFRLSLFPLTLFAECNENVKSGHKEKPVERGKIQMNDWFQKKPGESRRMCIKEFWRHFHQNAGSLNTFQLEYHCCAKCQNVGSHFSWNIILQLALCQNVIELKKETFSELCCTMQEMQPSGKSLLELKVLDKGERTFSPHLLNPHFLPADKIACKSDLRQRGGGRPKGAATKIECDLAPRPAPPLPQAHMGVHTGPIRGLGWGQK